jgi:hypothetical protein
LEDKNMAWSMQEHMHHLIAPTIWAFLLDFSEEQQVDWLAERLSDNTFDVEGDLRKKEDWYVEVTRLGVDWGIEALAGYVEAIGTTDNGGHEFWLDDGGYTTLPWCDDETVTNYYDNVS